MISKKIEVFIDVNNVTISVGTLFVDVIRNKEKYSFEYYDTYIKNKIDYLLDPELPIQTGRIFKEDSSTNFGCFQDSTPDRWGHRIIDKLVDEGKPFLESDYLCFISDNLRCGALRLKIDNEFINYSNEIPPFVFLNKLEQISYEFELDKKENLKILLAPGSSLGGARPKANVYDSNNEIYIAKFPSKNDEYDVELWEKIVNDLAEMCGINVPVSKILKVSKRGSTFLTKRFDRNGKERLHFISFMTLLGENDGNSCNHSYLDLVEIINSRSGKPKEDLYELFKRIAFSIMIHNGDDHLRNHGFIYKNSQFCLSPVFDINPSLEANSLSISIDGEFFGFDLNKLVETSKFYFINKNEAFSLVDNMKKIIKENWIKLAHKYKAKESEIKNFDKIVFSNL